MPNYLRRSGATDLHVVHSAQSERFPFLLESRQYNPKTGRYSLLLGDVEQQLQCTDASQLGDFFHQLEAPHRIDDAPDELPFCGGWFVYLAYEAAGGLLPHLRSHMPIDNAALARAAYCRSGIVVDHAQQCSWFIGDARHMADQPAPRWQSPDFQPMRFAAEKAELFCDQVQTAIEYIYAGDIYQANLSRRWQGEACTRQHVLQSYNLLRRFNPACFAASALWDDFALASASPERLFRLQNGMIETRPIAGTRACADDPDQDQLRQRELRSHPKEQAEHIMLVDLERHDLGRIARPGSVKVDELLVLESYASVHHLVSNVQAELRADVGMNELFSALFPGGTITGCPKIRCMQIVAQLENRARGPYTGSLGYISDCGHMDFNILIRTLVWQNGRLHLDAGAGIVADSQALEELSETQAKAQGVLRALGQI